MMPEVQLLELDFSRVQSELRKRPVIRSADILGNVEGIFPVQNHLYRRIDDSTFLHVMDFQARQAYSLAMMRQGFLCIQVMLSGDYIRQTRDRLTRVDSSNIQITNTARSISETAAGVRLRGALIALEREHFINRYGIDTGLLPDTHEALLLSHGGLPLALHMPAKPDIMVPAEQILSCRLKEPVKAIYLKAKVEEILCLIATHLGNFSPVKASHRAASHLKQDVIELAAHIYRRELQKPPTVEQLSVRVGLNRNDLHNGFKELFGVTPHAYRHNVRMELAQRLLQENALSTSEIARRVGFGGYTSLSRAYREHFGHLPSVERTA
jgi:AraC family transcriptional regulator, transcriptional activator of the genes for pyochelin and ferripyochelin receptors